MKINLKGFWNDEDGLSMKDYIAIVLMTLYIGLILGTIIFVIIYQTSTTYESTLNKLMSLIALVDDPIKIIITAYFVTNLAGNISVNTNKTETNSSSNSKNENVNSSNNIINN